MNKLLFLFLLTCVRIVSSHAQNQNLPFEEFFCHRPEKTIKSYKGPDFKLSFENSKLKNLRTNDSGFEYKDEKLLFYRSNDTVAIAKGKKCVIFLFKDTIWKIFDSHLIKQYQNNSSKTLIPSTDTSFIFKVCDMKVVCLREYKYDIQISKINIFRQSKGSKFKSFSLNFSSKGIQQVLGLKIIGETLNKELNVIFRQYSFKNDMIYLKSNYSNSNVLVFVFQSKNSTLRSVYESRTIHNESTNRIVQTSVYYFEYLKDGKLIDGKKYYNGAKVIVCE